MSRNLSASALAKIAEQVGTEPIVLIDIQWTSTTSVRYADKRISSAQGHILELSNLNQTVNLNGSNSVASIDVVLDDTDGFIKNTINTTDIHRVDCIVYQYFTGLDIEDKFELFRGELVSPITWNEGERTVSFSIVTRLNSYEVGFAPEEGQFPGLQDDLIGKVWPLCFGQPVHVPAQLVSNVRTGTLLNMFTIPDFTLTYKKSLLYARLDKMVAAYESFQNLITKCEQIARPAYTIQDDYANRIVSYDHLRQTIEDGIVNINYLNKQIDTLTGDFFGEDDEFNKLEIKTKVQNLKTARDKQIEILKENYNAKRDHELFFERLDTEIDNSKYKLTVINRLRQKCYDLIKQYYQTLLDIKEVESHISEQYQNYTNPLTIIYGTAITQGAATISLGGNSIQGQFINNAFVFDRVKPLYDTIAILPAQDDDKNAIWLADQTLKLSGKYLWLDNNRIVKVTGQKGNKCTISLPRKNKNLRSNAKNFDYEGSNTIQRLIQEGLKRLLLGNETAEQFNTLANSIPKELSPRIYKKIYGTNKVQIITLEKDTEGLYSLDYDKSYISLLYGKDEETDVIFFDDDADAIKNKILASTLSIGENDIEVEVLETDPNNTSTDYWVKLKLTLLDLMLPFRIGPSTHIESDIWEVSNSVSIKTIDTTPTEVTISINRDEIKQYCIDNQLSDGTTTGEYDISTTYKVKDEDRDITFGLIFGSKKCDFVLETTTGDDIQQRLEDDDLISPGEIEVTGGPLPDSDIIFTYSVPYRAFLFECINFEVLAYTDARTAEKRNLTELGVAKLELLVEGGNAFEYTTRERQARIDNKIEANINAPAIKKSRDAVRTVVLDIENADNESDRDSLKSDLQSNLLSYTILASQIEQEEFKTNEIYKAISDQEYHKLLELEITGYLEWVNKARDLDVKLEDNDYEFDNTNITAIKGVANQPLQEWMQWIDAIQDPFEKLREIELLPDDTSAYYAYAGERVTLEADYQVAYVANLLPSTVNSVYAYRNVGGYNRLVPVPSSYYVVNGANPFGPYSCTTISLVQPLKQIDQSWSDEIFVTLTSSIGPNVADTIQWIVEHYTRYSVDATSFTHVRALLVNYPANFALFDKRDAMTLIEDIAWQSRCSLKVRGHTIYIRYLPEEPTSVTTITEDDVEQNSLQLTFTDTEEIVTKFTATYKPHYALPKPWLIVLRRNLAKYYINNYDRDFFIYNIKELVYKSATFWIIRKGNTYKKAVMKLFLNKLNLDIDDCVTLDFDTDYFSTGSIKGIVEQATYNSDSRSIDCVVWLPIVSGSMTADAFAWPKDLSVQYLYPLSIDVAGGNAGSPSGIKVPTSLDFDPVNDIEIRPKDFGTSKLSDTDDEMPQNPANEFEQLDYEPSKPEPFKMPPEPAVVARPQIPEWDELGLKKHKEKLDAEYEFFVAIGRIIGKGDTEEVDLETVNESDPDVSANSVFYKVQLNNGNTIEARPVNYDNSEDLPNGLGVLIVFDRLMQEYQFQPPVYTSEEEIPAP